SEITATNCNWCAIFGWRTSWFKRCIESTRPVIQQSLFLSLNIIKRSIEHFTIKLQSQCCPEEQM
ncbi:hypothetical protein L9F63_014008, partial [Diploptera punctata]